MQYKTQIAVFGLAAVAKAHFVLQVPTSLGFDDAVEATGPCGSFDPTDRSVGVTDWPIAGAPIGVLTTHTHVTWEYKAALLTDITNFVPLTPILDQTGVGSFCEGNIPGNPAWVGKDAVLQVIQHGVDGTLFQCAAIKFTNGGASPVPGDCTNSTGTSAFWMGGGGGGGGGGGVTTKPPTGTTDSPTGPSSTPETTAPSSSDEGTTEPTSAVESSTSEPTGKPSVTTPGGSSETTPPAGHTHAPTGGNSTAPTGAPTPSTITFPGSSNSMYQGSAALCLAGVFAGLMAWML